MSAAALGSRLRAAREPRGFSSALFVASCLPALVAIAAMASDILRHTRLFGSNPIKEGEHFLGEWCLRFLIATLAVSPLREWLGWHWLAKHRRTLGLFAFAYAVLHWLTYALLDVQLDWDDLKKDLAERPYIMVGMGGLALLVPLAVTSSAAAIRSLGGRRWRRLHQLVWVIVVLGVAHFWMAVKRDIEDPLIFASFFAVLFAYRLVRWRRGRAQRVSASASLGRAGGSVLEGGGAAD